MKIFSSQVRSGPILGDQQTWTEGVLNLAKRISPLYPRFWSSLRVTFNCGWSLYCFIVEPQPAKMMTRIKTTVSTNNNFFRNYSIKLDRTPYFQSMTTQWLLFYFNLHGALNWPALVGSSCMWAGV